LYGSSYEFLVEEWVVDFLRPTADSSGGIFRKHSRKTPFDIPDDKRGVRQLVNGQYPGPIIECYENDTVSDWV